MSGSGKRADQKKTLVLNLPYKYFGKKGNIARKKLIKDRKNQINIDDIVKKLNGKKEVEFKNYKILSRGDINIGITIKATPRYQMLIYCLTKSKVWASAPRARNTQSIENNPRAAKIITIKKEIIRLSVVKRCTW